MKSFINILFVLALFPEASILPVSTNDTQPLFPIIALIYLFYAILKNKFKLDKMAKYLLLFSVCSILMVNYLYFDFGKYTSIYLPIFTFSIYFFAFKNIKLLEYKTVTFVIHLYLFVSLIQQFFPQLYISLFSNFLSVYRWEVGGLTRGNNSLCVEPSHMAMVGVALYLISKELYLDNKGSKKIFWINTFSLLIIEFLTKSVFSYLFFVIIIIDNFKLIIKHPKLAIIPFSFTGFFVYNLLSDTTSRFGSFFLFMIENPLSFLFKDQSFAMRINGIFYGLTSVFYYPFGLFRLEYIPEVLSIYTNSFLFNFIFPPVIHDAIVDYMTNSFSGIGPYFMRMGLVFVVIVMAICIHVYKKNKLYLFVLLMYLLNFSIISAPIWILISLLQDKNNKYKITQ
ncbi:hypothetical protein DWB61_16950 [Ancylomarina euxinus]|uniref:O-antigen ligase domain-containing protein n=1 Tax=Ancylomarina euxinus TaxID=2283627 RepID=A0A425XWR1_9BACT|nr:hypothetical protein [Ancylomarina euxinus]MCZ4696343.1 hypothetical protein [Ancylomarina euxinus]MUP16756.1 hypothetical protein [Ancylomarina euxinus]RRG19076.1 hypothetical protein DWB61_16950 [Ancylomarina euxinus]